MAKTLGTIYPDTFHGQAWSNGTVQIYPFTGVTSGDTFQLPPSSNPTAVAWQATATTDRVAVTLANATKLVTFTTAGVTALAGNLIVACGGGH